VHTSRWLPALLLIAAAPLAAQRTDVPDVKVGDRWQFVEYATVPSTRPNREWIITSVTGSAIVGTQDGEPLRLTRNLSVQDSPTVQLSNPRTLEFPLEVGKRWRYDTEWLFKPKRARGKSAIEVEVTSYETVAVPAGEFAAFRLTSRETLSGTSPIGSRYDAVVTRTYWYAPAARAIVKVVSRNPYLGPSTIELVAADLRD
jgi:hypothetical protein